jgi:acyl-CoA thioesterase-2
MRPSPTGTAGEVFDAVISEVLRVEALGGDRFVSRRPQRSLGRVYGGEVAAQGLCAAAATVDGGRAPHSLHVSYLGLGDPDEPLEYEVRRLRDSRLYATRWVTASQGTRLIATLTASFQAARPGLRHQLAAPDVGALPPPESLPTRAELVTEAFGADAPAAAAGPWPIDIRYLDHAPWARPSGPDRAPANRLWLRCAGSVPADELSHAAVLTYASDLTMFEPVAFPHNTEAEPVWEQLSRGEMRGATLEHTIWFHRPVRVDEWLLHEQESPIADDSRGLATGRFYTGAGELVASVAQEVAILHVADASSTARALR